jgi:hypothetical protein
VTSLAAADPWIIAIWLYLAAAFLTLLPSLFALVKGVRLNPPGKSFQTSSHFSTKARARLVAHYSRLQGTLGFWKNRAVLYTRFHYYCIGWTILSAWAVPLVGALAPQVAGSPSKWLLVIISSHVALALSFHRGLKVSEGMKGFRHGESEFYDVYRRLLDRPNTFGATEEKQLDRYFAEVEAIRRLVRHAETETIPDVDDVRRVGGAESKTV